MPSLNEVVQARWKPDRKKSRGVATRVEELGKLNDERMRLMKLPDIDADAYKALAKAYWNRGMKTMAREVMVEGGLKEVVL